MTPPHVEWPTIAVAVAIAGGLGAVLTWHEHLPTIAVVVALALLSGWYGSLQHEVIHGHPTPWPVVNTALASVPIGLVVRFADYRRTHLDHHAAPDLTDPDTDPESFYVSPQRWARAGPLERALLIACSTLAGRLILGPVVVTAGQCRREARAIRAGQAGRVFGHVATVIVVLAVVRTASVPVWVYVLGAGWGGLAVVLLRSYPEHRAVADGSRSAVVRSNLAGRLLFLNNNLHHTHHAQPGLAWYALPAAHERRGDDAAVRAGAGWYRGYGEVARRHLFRPLDDLDWRLASRTDVVENGAVETIR